MASNQTQKCLELGLTSGFGRALGFLSFIVFICQPKTHEYSNYRVLMVHVCTTRLTLTQLLPSVMVGSDMEEPGWVRSISNESPDIQGSAYLEGDEESWRIAL